MTIERYNYYVDQIQHDFVSEYEIATKELAKSKSKKKDFAIIQNFFDQMFESDNFDFDKYEEMITDCNAMLPMPESVSKQLACRLFEPKHLNPLFDLGIYEGFY